MLAEQLERFKQTGMCENHHYIKSHPFATAEGKFTLDCCPICKKAKINYKGITYNDDVMSIVRFISHQGIEFERAKLKIEVPDWNIEESMDWDIEVNEEQPNWNLEPIEVEQMVW